MNRIITSVLLLSLSFSPTFAQIKEAGKTAATQAAKGAKKFYVRPQFTTIALTPRIPLAAAPSNIANNLTRGISLQNHSLWTQETPANTNHSLVPSGATILGSEKNIQSGTLIGRLQEARHKIQTNKFKYYNKKSREALRKLVQNQSGVQPKINQIDRYLPHRVPQVTFNYLQKSYEEIVGLERNLSKRYFPFLVRVMSGEEWETLLPASDYSQFYLMARDFLKKVGRLRGMLPEDPYLLEREHFWQEAVYQVAPADIKGLLANPNLERPNARPYNANEMFLRNPDGTEAWPKGIPEDEVTLIRDPDDEISTFQEIKMMRRDQALAAQLQSTLPSVMNNFYKAVFNRELSVQEQELVATAMLRNQPVELEANTPKFKIYVVNDDKLPRKNWERLRNLPGIEVQTFEDGFKFMEAITNNHTQPNLVIMDLLVGNGGKAIMEDFRAHNNTTPVLAFSKWEPGEKNTEELFEKNGFDGYMWNNYWLNESILFPYYALPALTNYFNILKNGGWAR